MTWTRRFTEALVTAGVVAGYVLFQTMTQDATAMEMAGEAGMAAFATLAAQMGIAGVNSRRAR